MADTKFTPGPWEASGYCGTEVYAGLKCIAQLPFGCGVDDLTMKHNARLLAASPELYASLLDAVTVIRSFGFGVEEYEAVLAKARGEDA